MQTEYNENTNIDLIIDVLRQIFSWVVLMPISVIVTGKFLQSIVEFEVSSKQLFKIPLYILTIEAKNGEVILGFTSFIITLLLVGGFAGQPTYNLFTANFGVDPGHFNSICIFSSFLCVLWSFLLFLLFRILGGNNRLGKSELTDELSKLIEEIKNKNNDGSN